MPDRVMPDAIPTVGGASWLVPARVDRPELLDLGQGSPDDVRRSFDDLWRINRYFGGISAITAHLYPRLQARSGRLTVADLGAGSGQIAATIAAWAARRGRDVRVYAVDLAARNLDLAALAPGVTLVQADVNRLPFTDESVDYVISSLFLHHFGPEQVVSLLRAAYTRARHGLVMCDVTRGWMPLAAFTLAQPVFAHSYLTRYDGVVSIRRAYTPAELAELARAAGLTNVRVTRHWAWRMTLVADK